MNVKNKKSKLERDFGRIELRKRIILNLPVWKIVKRKQRDENLPKDQKQKKIQSL